jgi:hypothetical protein
MTGSARFDNQRVSMLRTARAASGGAKLSARAAFQYT